ncbi:MAG: M48 family metallopeptidase [Anaeroplasmataceae bacterium]|nr:M48 family metallopeptidase [Anaeroplasmataceae bacterium]
MFLVQVNQQSFKVEVIYKPRNRRIYLRVKEGVLWITTPQKLSLAKIEDMIQKNFCYILKYMNKEEKVEDQIHLLGKAYHLDAEASDYNSILVGVDTIHIHYTNIKTLAKQVDELYTKELRNIVEIYAKDILAKFNITKPILFKYKNVKGYYGECFSKKGIIILSTRLAKYDLKYILSVIYHECAHFKYQNHQEEFYEYLEQRYPNYRKVQRELRKIRYNEKY